MGGIFIMDENQTINCTVESCRYNDCENQLCELKQIMVAPTQNINTEEPDESMCASYEYDDEK